MLESVTLKFTEGKSPITLPAQGITIFVGPNNSGKSLVLSEMERALTSSGKVHTKILDDFEITWPRTDDFVKELNEIAQKSKAGKTVDHIYIGRFSPSGEFESAQINQNNLLSILAQKNKYLFTHQFLRFFQIRLDGRTRFELTNDRPTGDLAQRPQNTFAHIFQDDDLRKEIRNIVHDAFGMYFVIDPLAGGTLRIRLSPTPPTHEEQSLAREAREFHKNALHIKDASDGVQAFIGILIAVRAGEFRCILVDEPEAFLHPPLARKLGFELANIVARNGGSLFASTHSPDFLIGCLQASPNVRVVRLEHSNGKSKGQIVDSAALTKFFKTPLIRSANVISSLFHDGVVITESDNDRAFYSEIYYRLAEMEKGYPSILFINAQNKQTIRDILGPLRTFGVAAAAIVDVDILKDGGATWMGWLKAAQLPAALHLGLGQVRGELQRRFADLGIDMKTGGGIDALLPNDRRAADELFDSLNQYGVFPTRHGELEDWLKALAVVGRKTEWTIAMLERLGSDPTSSTYIRPSNGDVWDFMRGIVNWIRNPARKGT